MFDTLHSVCRQVSVASDRKKMGGPTSVLIKLKQTNINDKFLKRVGLAVFALLLSAATPLTLLAQSIAIQKKFVVTKSSTLQLTLKNSASKRSNNRMAHRTLFNSAIRLS
jgi:hypothetical protein